jgi:prepilin-type N-terminal cleavage/methylation domain-containing protein
MRNRAFTLIELLVVIAIIAILAAILFPVFARAKESAKLISSLAQMRQLSMSAMMYASDHDDNMVPATMRDAANLVEPIIWTQSLQPYVKNKQIFVAVGADGAYAENWATRRQQSVGYSDATGVDPNSTALEGAAPPGTEGFRSAVNFSQADRASQIGLFALTPNAPVGNTSTNHRGYVFNPYNGLNDPGGLYENGLPMISDVDLVRQGDARYPNSPNLSPGRLKPIWARYGPDGKGAGRTPVVLADGHAKVYSANQLNAFGTVIWRFR